MVVIAASWRSRQRPSPLRGHGGGLFPLRGGHGGGLLYIDTKTTQNIASHATSAFFITGTCLGFAPHRGTCATRRIFRRNHRKKEEKSRKSHLHWPTGRGRWSRGGLRRAALEVTAVFCGHGRWFILEVFFGFSIWRLRRLHPQFAFIAGAHSVVAP